MRTGKIVTASEVAVNAMYSGGIVEALSMITKPSKVREVDPGERCYICERDDFSSGYRIQDTFSSNFGQYNKFSGGDYVCPFCHASVRLSWRDWQGAIINNDKITILRSKDKSNGDNILSFEIHKDKIQDLLLNPDPGEYVVSFNCNLFKHGNGTHHVPLSTVNMFTSDKYYASFVGRPQLIDINFLKDYLELVQSHGERLYPYHLDSQGLAEMRKNLGYGFKKIDGTDREDSYIRAFIEKLGMDNIVRNGFGISLINKTITLPTEKSKNVKEKK